MLEKINPDLKSFYEQNLNAYGHSAKGVGWKNEGAQKIRFDQLAKIITTKSGFSINDIGCGIADFQKYLINQGFQNYIYQGYDMLEDMTKISKDLYKENKDCYFFTIASTSEIQEATYSIASGIFNIRYNISDEEWLKYILDTINELNLKSLDGFAFNALTKYSDAEFMQPYLYYSDPLFLFDYCKRKFSRNVALLHDYNQYDFTILVRKAYN